MAHNRKEQPDGQSLQICMYVCAMCDDVSRQKHAMKYFYHLVVDGIVYFFAMNHILHCVLQEEMVLAV